MKFYESLERITIDENLAVVEIPKGLKHPAVEDWQDQGISGPAALKTLTASDTGVYGVLCDGITVVDFDPRNMGVPQDRVEDHIEFICRMFDLPDTFTGHTQ